MGAFLLWTPTGASSSYTLGFDVVLNENPQFPTQITEHMVEEGANISDNVRVGLRQITLETFVTMEPLNPATSWLSGIRAGGFVSEPINTPDAPDRPDVPPQFWPQWFSLPIGVPLIGSLISQVVNPIQQLLTYTAGEPSTLGMSAAAQVLEFPQIQSGAIDPVQLTHDALERLRTTKQVVSVYGTKGTYDSMVVERFEMTRGKDEGTGASFTVSLKEIRFVSTSIVPAPVPTVPRGNVQKSKGSQTTKPETQTPNKKRSLFKNWLSPATPPTNA